MPVVFPLTGVPKDFIPTAAATFVENIIDDILEEILYPYQRDTSSGKCYPTILTLNTFIQPLDPEVAMDMVDEFCSKKYKKHRLPCTTENYGLRKIYREYSDLKPTCFLVLGEPSEERYEAAKIFAKMTRRVHLDVIDLVNLEMSKESQCGKWIYTNLVEGRCIPVSVVLHLLRMAVKQKDVQNAGYILTGFPIITSHMLCADKLPHRLKNMDVLRAPPAEAFEKWRKEREIEHKIVSQPAIPQEESTQAHTPINLSLQSESMDPFERSVETLSTVTSSSSFSSREDTLNQVEYNRSSDIETAILEADVSTSEDTDTLQYIMNSANLTNKVKESDVARSVRHQLNFLMHIDLAPDIIFFIRKKYDAEETTPLNSNESFGMTENTYRMTKLFQLKSVIDELELDRQRERYITCLPEIGRFLMHFYKECVIKVDSRFSAEETAEQFRKATSFINYKLSHMPEQILLDVEDQEKVSQLSTLEGLEFLCRYKCVEPNLPWNHNEMGVLCPVKLKHGQFEPGKLNFAVRYMGDIYLCSSLVAMNIFIKDPTRYCKPKPNCRIAIMKSESVKADEIISLFEKVFNASSFRWTDSIKQSLDLVSSKIYDSAEIGARNRTARNEVFEMMNRDLLKNALNANTLDMNSRILMQKIYQLYKENHPSEIADDAIAWLRALDKYPKTQESFDKMYTQWILVDVPNQTDFWKKLEKEGCLPDIVLAFPDQWETVNAGIEDFQQLHDEVKSRCLEITLTFPYLVENIDKDLFEIVSNVMNDGVETGARLSTDSDEVGSDLEDEYIESTEHGEQGEGHGFLKEAINYLQRKNIPVLITQQSGPLALLEVFESYLNLFKQQPLKLNAEVIDELPEICFNSYPNNPELPKKTFTDYKSLYALDLQYLRKGAIFEYNQLLKNYEKIRVSNEIENKEDDVGVNSEGDPLLDIEVLSQENMKSMKELDCLRQLPLGNTGVYCPVSLHDQNCLRLGRLELTVKYHDLHYCMSTPQALRRFMKCAFPYAFKERSPAVPPYRIFVIGMAGPNRRSFMKILSSRLSMKPVLYSRLMAEYLHLESMDSDAILYSEDEVFETHGLGFLHTTLKERFNAGILCEGFPNNVSQLQSMVNLKLFPEVVYIVDENPNELLHTAFMHRYIQWEKQLQYKYKAYLNKLNRIARKSKVTDDAHLLVTRIRQDSADIKLELGKIKEHIKQQEEAAYGTTTVNDNQPVRSTDTRESASFQELNAESLNFSEHHQDDESFVDEETDQYPESPIPSAIDKIKYRQSLLQETKRAVKDEILALRKVIKLLISEKVPIISIPIYCSKNNCESKLKKCDHLFRKSIFDQVIIVSPNTADNLLSSGYALYSHFKNFCPIDAYDLMPINRHFSIKQQNKLYAALYRRHLFFINGSENVVKFYETPAWYAFKTTPFFLVVPMRILTMGPVCSGVTTLCERISTEFNFEVVDNTQYKNFITNELTNESGYSYGLASASRLRSSTSDELIEFLHFHRNDSPNGFVLDNLPVRPEELVNAARANIGIHLVLIIKCEFWSVWRNWRSAYLQNEPYKCVSVTDELSKLYSSFRNYYTILKKYRKYGKHLDLFNIVYLKNAASKWALWEEAKNEILVSLRDIGTYYKNIRQQQVVSLGRLNVFRAEFERRLSPVKLFCPSCLKAHKRLVKYRHDFYNVGLDFYSHSCQHEFNQPFGYNNESLYQTYGFPKLETVSTEKKPLISKNMFKMNLVEYKHNFYWSCDRHHIDIRLNGQTFLPPEPISYPGYLPLLVTNYYRRYMVNDGFCVATYCGQLPKKVYTLGDPNYAVFYRGKIFLCASADCALELLENPEYYYHFHMPPYEPPYEDLDLKSLQIDYGHLTPERIIEALKALSNARPKHIGLTIRDSALIFVGLYLKTINPISRAESIKFNEDLYSNFISECSFLEWLIKKFNQGNPFLKQ